MTVFLVIVTSHMLVSVDVYKTLEDAQARKVRAQRSFPQAEGFKVTLLEKYVSPELSAVFS